MRMIFRGMAFAVFTALILIIFVTAPAHAESWSSGVTAGLTSVESILNGGAYTWMLKNNTSLPGDDNQVFDILVWSLTPYQVNEPLTVVSPAGWKWNGKGWEVASNSDKYLTPNSVGPGKSLVFQYTPDPRGHLINASGPQPAGLAFITHVAAVLPDSGSANGAEQWTKTTKLTDATWHDKSAVNESNMSATPEPKGFIVMAFGIAGMGLVGLRRATGKRAQEYP